MPSSVKLPRGLRLSRPPEMSFYLGEKYFLITLAAVMLAHLITIYAWGLLPHQQVLDIPVRTLNIKLGDDEDEVQLAPENNSPGVNAPSHLVRPEEKTVKPAEKMQKFSAPAPDPKTAIDTTMPAPKQFVRQNSSPAAIKSAGGLGNSTASNAEMMSRYSQLISLWIQKFKIYPEEARAQGMEGETVVRVRIDRHGNIRYYALERSTGYALLDKAALDMVRRANPVPAMPDDVPSDELQEFLIPVNFK